VGKKPYTEYQKEIALDVFYALGANRDLMILRGSLDDTPEFPNSVPSHPTLKRWKRDNNWKVRCDQRDIENAKPRIKETDRKVANTKADYRVAVGDKLKQADAIGSRIVKLLGDVAQKLESSGKTEDGKNKPPAIEIKTIDELDKMVTSFKKYSDIVKDLVKLDLELIGESEGLRDVSINIAEAIMDGNYYQKS